MAEFVDLSFGMVWYRGKDAYQRVDFSFVLKQVFTVALLG